MSRHVETSEDKSRQVKTKDRGTKNRKEKDLTTYVDKPSTKTQGQGREGQTKHVSLKTDAKR